jgi:hypothetical protein
MHTLESAIGELKSIVATNRLAEAQEVDQVFLPGSRWTRKQILGHLIDSAANNHHRFVRAQFETDFAMPGYAQESWVNANAYQERSWEDLVALWTIYNRHLIHVMEHAPKAALGALCRIGAGDPVTLEFLMIDYVDHLQHHLHQILEA